MPRRSQRLKNKDEKKFNNQIMLNRLMHPNWYPNTRNHRNRSQRNRNHRSHSRNRSQRSHSRNRPRIMS